MAHGQRGESRGRFVAGFAITAACVAAGGLWLPVAHAAVPTIESLALSATYGDAVHAYFAGDYQRAYDDLSQVVEAGTIDPRVYYFRGLASRKLGRLDEAEADFTTGATHEAEGTGSWPVARSLERVQGCDRLALERHRTRARVVSLQVNRRRNALRYLEAERDQPEVLRRRRPVTERPAEEANPFREADEAPVEEMPAPPPPAPGDAGLGGAGEQADKATEELAAEREDFSEQVDQQREEGAAELEDAAGQRDFQIEAESVR